MLTVLSQGENMEEALLVAPLGEIHLLFIFICLLAEKWEQDFIFAVAWFGAFISVLPQTPLHQVYPLGSRYSPEFIEISATIPLGKDQVV